MTWVPLNVHSHYSILNAVGSPKAIVEKASSLDMQALALTDRGNLFGAIEFYKACKSADIKPIIGCEFFLAPSSRFEKTRSSDKRFYSNLILLAKDIEGYHNLCKLSSLGYLEGFYYYPRIDKELLEKYSSGLVCLSGNVGGSLSKFIESEDLFEEASWYKSLFADDYYLELQRHQMSEEDIQADGLLDESWLYQGYQDYISLQNKINDKFIDLSQKLEIKCVATNNSSYLERKDWRGQEILRNVQTGEPCFLWENEGRDRSKDRIPNPKRKVHFTHELYFKSQDEMQGLFADFPESVATSLEIAEKCSLEIDFKSKHYPVYIPPDLEGKEFDSETRDRAAQDYLWKLCEEGIKRRYTKENLEKVREQYPDREPLDVVRERLNHEMEIIVPKGLGDYLLIVYDFINWARKSGIPVGPGRGSGVGSIVLYLIGVTDMEPLRFNLFFERFINPERLSYPDIDVDICMDRRSEVIDYTVQKYGKDNVAQIITFGTMKAKMAIKDVGRILNVPLSKVNAITKLVPEELNITLDQALEKDADLAAMYESDEEVKEILDIGRSLEGSVRNTSIHAAGLIVCGEPLTDHIPVCLAKDSDIVATQYSMKPVEAVGMLKIDFLGLKTLTSIQTAVDAIAKDRGETVNWMALPLDDKTTFSLLNKGKTAGVFQIESGGMQELTQQLHIDKFEEIMAVIALYRPGPMDMIPSFINRKHGVEEIENDHPWMQKILDETYGVMVYQEQVMQVASRLANFSLGEGDVLRKAMGKKELREMAKQREKFVQGAISNEIDESTAVTIFDKMEKFAAYGFNKSHAAAYAYISYITAYLKANYPKEWMASLMTSDRDDITKVSELIREARSMGVLILPPDVNESNDEFRATDKGIRFSMTAIKGIGRGVVDSIVEDRQKNGHFESLYHFIERIDSKKIGRKATEVLVDVGCFDFSGWSRDAMRESIDTMCDIIQQERKEKQRGIVDFFSEMDSGDQFKKPPAVKNKTPKRAILMREKELLGFFLAEHPLDAFKEKMKRLSCISLKKVKDLPHDSVFRTVFIIEDAKIKMTNRGKKKFAILIISDGNDQYELLVWPDLFAEKGHLLVENQIIYAALHLEQKEGSTKLSCCWFDDFNRINEHMVRDCDIAYDKAKVSIERNKTRNGRNGNGKNGKVEKEKTLSIVLDIEKTKLNHILDLKRLFGENSGSHSVNVDFVMKKEIMGSIVIENGWSKVDSAAVKPQLKSIPVVVSSRVD